jgi:hypothetical protein
VLDGVAASVEAGVEAGVVGTGSFAFAESWPAGWSRCFFNDSSRFHWRASALVDDRVKTGATPRLASFTASFRATSVRSRSSLRPTPSVVAIDHLFANDGQVVSQLPIVDFVGDLFLDLSDRAFGPGAKVATPLAESPTGQREQTGQRQQPADVAQYDLLLWSQIALHNVVCNSIGPALERIVLRESRTGTGIGRKSFRIFFWGRAEGQAICGPANANRSGVSRPVSGANTCDPGAKNVGVEPPG